ncbi:MAG: tRNA pseudouridine(13) synthase TruD [Gammaproteobacteria bacterium]|jgi:tRNA pseudouridine13 synthase|nr:tRNA pseudouridine(13) synthase TruD [Gammaproteobacteria bacterium]
MKGNYSPLPQWAWAQGTPEVSGSLRVQLEDFRVQELPAVTPDGKGTHLWLEIEKCNANTDWVAHQLSISAGVPARDVGYAGMKDRRGVTSQWFSVALQEATNSAWENWSWPDIRILQACLHTRKLKRGTLHGNRFRIVVRDLKGGIEGLEHHLNRVAATGVPNYFGPQRFGHGGRNVVRGIHWLQNGGRLPRNKKSIYLSAVRSFLFNQVLSRRVERENWNRMIDGDIAVLDGSRSTFACTMPDPELEQRCDRFDIHPSGPLPGKGGVNPVAAALRIEHMTLEPHEALIHSIQKAGLKSARRSLRLRPVNMKWMIEGINLIVEFDLPPGGYATSVLRELVSIDSDTISERQ